MSEQASDTLRGASCESRQTMSIHTRKITDSCRDKDCIEDLRVYLTTGSQALLDTAANARVRCAELLTTYIDVEPVAFDGHHYCIDVTFYYRILADAVVGACRPAALYGLAVFTKRAVLCVSDSFYSLVQLHLNTKKYRRSRVKSRQGRSPVEIMTGESWPELIDLLEERGFWSSWNRRKAA